MLISVTLQMIKPQVFGASVHTPRHSSPLEMIMAKAHSIVLHLLTLIHKVMWGWHCQVAEITIIQRSKYELLAS